MLYDLYYPNLNFAHKMDVKPTSGPDFTYHYHKIYEILMLLEGDVEFILESKCYSLHPGDMIFVKPGQNHNINFRSFRPYERYVLKFPGIEIPQEIQSFILEKNGCYSIQDTPLFDLFSRLDYHYKHYNGSYLCELNKCVLREILFYFCSKDVPSADLVSYNQVITSLVEFIDTHIGEPISINEICEHFHYSKSYIYKVFLDEMNVPLMRYIRTKKVLYADSLIKRGVKPTNAFEQCGFSEYTSFFRAYKKIIGHMPSENEPETLFPATQGSQISKS